MAAQHHGARLLRSKLVLHQVSPESTGRSQLCHLLMGGEEERKKEGGGREGGERGEGGGVGGKTSLCYECVSKEVGRRRKEITQHQKQLR